MSLKKPTDPSNYLRFTYKSTPQAMQIATIVVLLTPIASTLTVMQ